MVDLGSEGTDFQKELGTILLHTQRGGEQFIDVVAEDLHRRVGGYPGPNHRMSVCCQVMRASMKQGDRIVKGHGDPAPNLVIRYKLPR